MTARFVLEESSWAAATEVGIEEFSRAVDQLVERLDLARERKEGVVKHRDYYNSDLGNGVQLYSALFEPDCAVRLEHDVVSQLRLALDHANDFEDPELVEYDVEFSGGVWFSPGVAWAHARCTQGDQVAVLPLASPEVPRGPVPVVVAGVSTSVFFVTEESDHVGFFRAVIRREKADEGMFERLAPSAFPALDWADGVWRGLRDFSRPYIEVRDELIRCLGGLSDHGATCFHEFSDHDPDHLSSVLSAKVGCDTSDENGRTKKHKLCKRDRTRRHRGTDKVFWWHLKLRPHVDRIYFLHEPQSADFPSGRVVVGILKDHCTLPN